MAAEEFGQWCPSPSDIIDPTPIKVRSLLIDCFFEAQKATMIQAGQSLGTKTDEETLRSNVEGVIRMGFKEVGADFENPTKGTLNAVLDVLARKASAWGTPKAIIDHHKVTMTEIIEKLP
jgi:hypothetical protein